MKKELDELKIQAFEIRRKIDIIEQQKVQLIQEYNSIYTEINKIEPEESLKKEKEK